MGMCCENMMMIGWRNAWSIKLKIQDQGEYQRTWKEVVPEDCQARKLNKEDAVDRCKWRKVIKEVRWPGWVRVREYFFWYQPTWVVPDQRPLNGRCCCMCEFRSNDRFRTNAPNTCKHSIRNDYVIVLIEAPPRDRWLATTSYSNAKELTCSLLLEST